MWFYMKDHRISAAAKFLYFNHLFYYFLFQILSNIKKYYNTNKNYYYHIQQICAKTILLAVFH